MFSLDQLEISFVKNYISNITKFNPVYIFRIGTYLVPIKAESNSEKIYISVSDLLCYLFNIIFA